MGVRTRLRRVIHRLWPPKPRPLILCYHRIADEPLDPWDLAVSPVRFEQQLEVLRSTRRPLPLADFVRDLLAGTLPSDAVSLTFDDGYLDNLVAAKPRLAKAGVPATVFLATGYLGRSGEFWWDELARLILSGVGPSNFELVVGGKSMHFDLDGGQSRRMTPADVRRAVLGTVWDALRRLDDDERQSVMGTLRPMFAAECRTPPGRPMSSDEAKALADGGLIAIGAHTVTHPVLSALAAPECHREIAESKAECERLIGAPVTAFAYPFGNFDATTREEVKRSGFGFACSTRYGPATAKSDIFALPRVGVHNWDGDMFEKALRSATVG